MSGDNAGVEVRCRWICMDELDGLEMRD